MDNSQANYLDNSHDLSYLDMAIHGDSRAGWDIESSSTTSMLQSETTTLGQSRRLNSKIRQPIVWLAVFFSCCIVAASVIYFGVHKTVNEHSVSDTLAVSDKSNGTSFCLMNLTTVTDNFHCPSRKEIISECIQNTTSIQELQNFERICVSQNGRHRDVISCCDGREVCTLKSLCNQGQVCQCYSNLLQDLNCVTEQQTIKCSCTDNSPNSKTTKLCKDIGNENWETCNQDLKHQLACTCFPHTGAVSYEHCLVT